ncbi:hypothetical protein BDN72DRAFT_960272 [Pluteus cervinus]|uniref:Uncharacterized protein n=1 Tax=Pluteus cervinus TaxID=181527 RepID=A0ACD3ASF2_9AGAR|nr:hypothetical protein BDN72DRAFT_960272 [Pluteus cervinus]
MKPDMASAQSTDDTQPVLSQEEYITLGGAISGPAGEDKARQFYESTMNNTWQLNSFVGYCTNHHADIHIFPLDDDFSIVYWGGQGAEAVQFWSFQISRRRSDASTVFDEDLDTPVDLTRERIRLFTSEGSPTVPFMHGKCGAPEGTTIFLERSFEQGPPKTIPITFPIRKRPGYANLPNN